MSQLSTPVISNSLPEANGSSLGPTMNLDGSGSQTRVGTPVPIIPRDSVFEANLDEDTPVFGLGGLRRGNLKDIGAAFAVVAVFIASISVGLLSYTHDIFTDRPKDTDAQSSDAQSSDSAVTSLFFITVIFSGVAAMEFTALQLSRSGSSTYIASARSKEIKSTEASPRQSTMVPSPTTPTRFLFIVADLEKGGTVGEKSKTQRRNSEIASVMVDNMAVTSVCLLFLSCVTLFAGIFTFVWANQTRSVAIAITVVFGLWCISPLRYVALFLASLIKNMN
ncbi:hypothetical protein SCHPADRAFT_890002 [Schizopora paradoxa]|uniref:PGG domain-containing protein n=1 Tax=Schizopora paradoxa TaxID=27342 RepID=A0A0H2RVL7_9AGAM|nr:hypothetical protein SCHPADRAFT_890002 [Schizopora paradoxa]